MFQGNGIYMTDGQATLPPGVVADRLAQGNFGPVPNQSAPPGFQIPRTLTPEQLANALGTKAPAAAPSAPAPSPMNPGESQFDFLSRMSLVDPGKYLPQLYQYQIQNPNWHNMGAPMMDAYGL